LYNLLDIEEVTESQVMSSSADPQPSASRLTSINIFAPPFQFSTKAELSIKILAFIGTL
jgi:hypothetical protein